MRPRSHLVTSTLESQEAGTPMRPFFKTRSLFLLAALGLLLISSCTKPENNSLYDPNVTFRPQPGITSISPTGSAVAGIDTIIIQGTNFSSVLPENSVFFNASPATLLAATTTQITLRAPLVPSDSIGVRVVVQGAIPFSNIAQYKLKAAVATFGGLLANDTSTSLATDANGNLYCAYLTRAIEAGVSKFTPAGVRSSYAPATAGVALWSSLKMGPSGYMYAARNFRALYRYSPGGGSSAALWLAFPTGTAIADIDFDQSGNCWGGGNNSNIYRIDQSKVITTFPFVGNIRSVRVYNGYLYFSAKTNAGEKIWRAQISASGMGTPELYFDFAAVYPTNAALTITFSSDGTMYVGTDAADGLLVVNPNKTYNAPYGVYKASFGTGLAYFAWGNADDLYASTSNGILLKLTIRGKTSAPYYGSKL
ncbi:MAG: IPT/TIG domain-containing protein [Ignavibacteriales bacterium]|nr:IPT/TIG domain-containing protein [Ignavibacteriales bacterium]